MEPSMHHLAQINIGRMRAPLDSPVMADFVSQLDTINALAETSPGFVWRLQGEGNDATSLRPFDDDFIIVNMSVWESLDDLRAYVYKSAHTAAMRRRREWFEHFDGAYVALWWVEAGHHRRLARPSSSCYTWRRTGRPPMCSHSSSCLRRRLVCGKIALDWGLGHAIADCRLQIAD